jgi:hypothetical protein
MRMKMMPYKDRDRRIKHSREYGKGWYQQHKQEVMARSKKKEKEIKKWYRDYKRTLYCMICGENHPACLQFHHRDRSEKSFSISNIAMRPTSKKRILNEIKKCDVLCVNCHAKLHWRETHETDSWEEVLPPIE